MPPLRPRVRVSLAPCGLDTAKASKSLNYHSSGVPWCVSSLNEVLVLLDHESAAHFLDVVRCGVEVFNFPRRFHAMPLRVKVWHCGVHMVIVHACATFWRRRSLPGLSPCTGPVAYSALRGCLVRLQRASRAH